MNRSTGAMVMLAVFILAGARHAASPARVSPSTASGANSSRPQKTNDYAEANCDAFDGTREASGSAKDASSGDGKSEPLKEINLLVERYLGAGSRNGSSAKFTVPAGVRFMIVTVPDPLHTHLSLQFDRTLEAVQQALQDEKFTYDSSWLPWKKPPDNGPATSGANAEEKEAASRERCPGLVLFRRNMGAQHLEGLDCPAAGTDPQHAPYDCGLFAFVVAETPTVGLNQDQWSNALSWIDQHAPNRSDKVLRVLGPTFSGSMPSIVRALAEVEQKASSTTSALLYSGRIRGCAPWLWLNEQLHRPDSLPVRTADFEENDAIELNRFYGFLAREGHSLSEVAVLSEDETAYGGLPDAHSTNSPQCEPEYKEGNRPIHLYYPRDISAIRSAYQEQSIFSTGSAGESASVPHTVLQPQYEGGTHVVTDTIQPFSGQGMALTQEAQLYGIVDSLQSHAIRFVVLRSTNSLDYLFLARFLHRAYPDAFVITMGSDMLFGREVDSTEFRGVVALTTFPLLPRGQDWTKQIGAQLQHAHRVFGSDIMEGVYLAARFLTTDAGRGKESSCQQPTSRNQTKSCTPFVHLAKKDIPDYAAPFWDRGSEKTDPCQINGQNHPSTWLSVVGRDGYWPLAVLESSYPCADEQVFNLAQVAKSDAGPGTNLDSAFGGLTLSSAWKFACFLAVLLFCAQFAASFSGWKREDFAVFIHFTPSSGDRQAFLMTCGWAVVCSLLILLFLASNQIYSFLHGINRVWVWVVCAAAEAACVSAIVNMGPWRAATAKGIGRIAQRRLDFYILWCSVVVAFIATMAWASWRMLECGKDDPNLVLIAYRSIHLSSGVSPITSILIILAGYYWWFWQELSGLALLGRGRPILPRRAKMDEALARVSCAAATSVEDAAMPIPNWHGQNILLYILPVVLLFVQACVLQRPWTQGFDTILHSLENKPFNWALHLMLGMSGYLVIVDCFQLTLTWLALKRLLLALNRLPLRRTFAALRGLSMHSLWSMSGASSRARYTIFSHQIETLVHLRNELEVTDGPTGAHAALRTTIRRTVAVGLSYIEKRSGGEDLAILNDAEAHAIRITLSRCTEAMIGVLLIPAWSVERMPMDPAPDKDDDKQKTSFPLNAIPSVRLAEEFVCLIYVAYLQNMLARMRTLVLSMAGVFVAIALSLAFYPYTPRPLLALSLMLLLVTLGAVVAVVYAGMDRDNTLSHITNTTPGALGSSFWIRIASFVGVPALGLLVAQFPEITDFVSSWIAPSVNGMK